MTILLLLGGDGPTIPFLVLLPVRYTCSSPEDDAVFLLLPVKGPVIVTSKRDGDQACFCVDLDEGDDIAVPLEGGHSLVLGVVE